MDKLFLEITIAAEDTEKKYAKRPEHLILKYKINIAVAWLSNISVSE